MSDSRFLRTLRQREYVAALGIFAIAIAGDGFLGLVADCAEAVQAKWGIPSWKWRVALWCSIAVLLLVVAATVRAFRLRWPSWRSTSPLRKELRGFPHSPELVPATAALTTLFGTLIEQSNAKARGPWARRLALTAVRKYLERIHRIKKGPESTLSVFPCTFEVYAACVVQLLDDVKRDSHEAVSSSPGEIWTRWSGSLLKWYNPTVEAPLLEGAGAAQDASSSNHADWMHSHSWWEQYKLQMTKLKAEHASSTGAWRVHRVVHAWDPSAQREGVLLPNQRAVVYVPPVASNPTGLSHPLCRWSPLVASALEAAGPHVTLLPQVDRALETWKQRPERLGVLPLTLIGVVEASQWKSAVKERAIGCWPQEGCWLDVREHFEMHYHDQTRGELQDKLGAYCRFTERSPLKSEYDDVFVLDGRPLTSRDDDIFGLGFYEDRVQALSGMTFLDQRMANEVLDAMRETWRRIDKEGSTA